MAGLVSLIDVVACAGAQVTGKGVVPVGAVAWGPGTGSTPAVPWAVGGHADVAAAGSSEATSFAGTIGSTASGGVESGGTASSTTAAVADAPSSGYRSANAWRALTASSPSRARAVTASSGTADSKATADPPANVPVPTAMAKACAAGPNDACDTATIAAIDRARALERVHPLRLPPDYERLPVDAQLLVVADLERTDRGLPGFSGLSAELDRMAATGAQERNDPTGPRGTAWGSNFAMGYAGALQADYAWMYDDGLGSPNTLCKPGALAACWGHRNNILANYGPHPSMGAAALAVRSGSTKLLVVTQLFSCCPAGSLDFKLARALGASA